MGPGLDHGVFVPFRIMFGEEFMDIPIVQVSIDASMDPEKNWEAGKAVAKLRCVDYLQQGYILKLPLATDAWTAERREY